MQIAAIREARTAKVAQARALTDGEMTADKAAAFDKLKAEITALEADEARAQFIDDMERRAAGAPVDKALRSLEQSVTVGDAIRAQIEQRAVTGALAEFSQEMRSKGVTATRGGVLVPSSIFEKRTTQTTALQSAITPDDYRPQEMIGLLRNSTIVRSLGARVLTGLHGDLVLPKKTGSCTTQWIKEGEALTESNPTHTNVKATPKHVGALASYSRQLLMQANPSIEQILRDDFVEVVGLAVDKALLHGLAANDEPTGILNTAGIQTASLATLSWNALLEMVEKLALVNVLPNAVLTNPKVATLLKGTLKAASAGSEYLMQGGQVADIAAHITNQLDNASPTAGALLMGDFSQVVIGEWGSTEILANPYAPTFYEKGDIQIRILHSMDALIRHPQAFVAAQDVAI